ncbi:DUF3309 family protein [Rhizobium sp. VS19-DR104.2]|nr:DUF3309 family protein [Rhizobium sp. VS19-DR96]MBZ5767520.1 DUF3309 family protein [Rhizobium sp. VS19-DR129.2]MBZ5775030.1 DUF3309 family protein [Rhizobium sp. VS19-DRK62.2]MBZ5786003.1 DUF3309 family protein [Rhizobium sp. VS19-DR121]MBZ5803431.1 DUF3309 family protein [Rhizobium sp. VS19-DR181]MBZ5819109.1 DUF3309 family protein [Rhizobium sp. VS19-DR183]MBZ5831682.1 DUF3309 family protein [Rhizobium sp. VS19-DR104.2]MBZ5843081.1 DUF3309 family protein [Rhizobium sp. VS19-DR104.1]
MLRTVLLVILIFLVIGARPSWGYIGRLGEEIINRVLAPAECCDSWDAGNGWDRRYGRDARITFDRWDLRNWWNWSASSTL